MKVDFCVSSYVINQGRTKIAVIFHHKLKKWIQAGWHIESWELPHEAAIREAKEELGIRATLDKKYHTVDETQKELKIIPQPLAIQRNIIPERKWEPAHIHCDFRYILIANDAETFWGENNQSKRMTKDEVLAIDDEETFKSVKYMAETYLI